MIKVSAYANITVILPSPENHEEFVKNKFESWSDRLKTENIITISKPFYRFEEYCSNVYARFTIHLPEDEECKNIDDYTGKVLPFIKDHLTHSIVTSTKVIRLQKVQDPLLKRWDVLLQKEKI
ncbi:hypothetical protein [Fictibacillus phosphorivorans]|uniref:hypothetical protein n=1 Tax=Fictibacillus phosphorivorans TaxID=1221500 RepID=UPI0035E78470